MKKSISGFSKLSKLGKLKWLVENFFKDPERVMKDLMSYWLHDEEKQKIIDGFSENTISNFYLPYGVAPNFLINEKTYCVPMVIEESSVVAAAASAAKFWLHRGGFHAEVISTKKVGQIHFCWDGNHHTLNKHLPEIKQLMYDQTADLTKNMRKRGGGIVGIELLDLSHIEPSCYQLHVKFETVDSMGANFINSVLEKLAKILDNYVKEHLTENSEDDGVEIIMSILSNYTPECLVRAWVVCPVSDLGEQKGAINSDEFARRFQKAVRIAHIDPYRATTHNKGIFNGIDAVVLATANDFRAVEACGHAYAARDGQYRSLTDCSVADGIFKFSIEMPLALGTIGGLTSLHPMAKRSLELLGHPDAGTLMMIIASIGLAQNFAAIRSLVTTGIQQGHMRMHLINILNRLDASEREMDQSIAFFSDRVVSHAAVRSHLALLRSKRAPEENTAILPT
ncbi:MAG: hydroxymethylglutaryl-CoA reductase, degradative [Saprospiraceae bacterium]|nr:hydroxymethylglutaryl-CoA reductase, degradative [Saprospiraceae bacterium]